MDSQGGGWSPERWIPNGIQKISGEQKKTNSPGNSGSKEKRERRKNHPKAANTRGGGSLKTARGGS